MSGNSTLDNFFPPAPEEVARRNAMTEIKDEVGKFKNKIHQEIGALKKGKKTENRPTELASLDHRIAEKEKEFHGVDCVFDSDGAGPVQDHFRQIIGWNEIMRKHGVAGY